MPLSSLMDSQVFVQVSLLSKALIATWFLAGKWSLTCMNSQMIKKVMPLSEKHLAVGVVTFKDLHISLRPRIFILVNSKLPCLGNTLIDLDGVKVKAVSSLNIYKCSCRYLFSNSPVSDLMSLNELTFATLFSI